MNIQIACLVVLVFFALMFAGIFIYYIVCVHKCDSSLQRELDSIISEMEKYNGIDIYNMAETDLRQYGASKGLSEEQINILCFRIYNHLKIGKICNYLHFGRETIKYHLEQIKSKLGITSL